LAALCTLLIFAGFLLSAWPLVVAGLVVVIGAAVELRTSGWPYVQAVWGAQQQWGSDTAQARTAARDALAQHHEAVGTAVVPDRLSGLHERLLDVCTPSRVHSTTLEWHTKLAELEHELAALTGPGAEPCSAQEGAYLSDTSELLAALSAEREQLAAETLRSWSEVIANLEAVKPDTRLAAQHAALTGALRTEFIALSEQQNAIRAADQVAAAAAEQAFADARAETRRATQEINAPFLTRATTTAAGTDVHAGSSPS
jgi:hypothetical protein